MEMDRDPPAFTFQSIEIPDRFPILENPHFGSWDRANPFLRLRDAVPADGDDQDLRL